MPITASPSPWFIGRSLLIGIVCLGLGIWGVYDLLVTIPHREQAAARYETASKRLKELADAQQKHLENGTPLRQEEIDDYNKANDELKAISPDGKAPVQPSKFDRPVQWLYILCLPFAIPALLNVARVWPQRYRLEEDGSLRFAGDREHGSGMWAASEIADIDMHRWMAKSVAWVVKSDGTRLKLDAFHHRNLEQVIGSLAARFHPEQWDADARPIKKTAAEAGEEAVEGANSGPESGPGSEKIDVGV